MNHLIKLECNKQIVNKSTGRNKQTPLRKMKKKATTVNNNHFKNGSRM